LHLANPTEKADSVGKDLCPPSAILILLQITIIISNYQSSAEASWYHASLVGHSASH